MTNEEIIEQLLDINIEMCKTMSLASIGLLHTGQIEKIVKRLETLRNEKEEK